MVAVISSGGSRHELSYDSAGRLARERHVDGRVLRYRYDAAHRRERIERSGGGHVSLRYDATGNLLARSFDDSVEESFAYDVRGLLVRADGPDARCVFEHDAAGRCVAETVTIEGTTYRVDVRYDAAGDRLGRATSLQHALAYRRFDPEVGLFISPDPSGIKGELNPYLRGVDPVHDVDVTGRNSI